MKEIQVQNAEKNMVKDGNSAESMVKCSTYNMSS